MRWVLMDKIEKVLVRLSSKERKKIKSILVQISNGETEGMDIKKLKGREDIFRARKGSIRIMYRVTDKETRILSIARRNEKTYK
jgi:mRNA-degrading endonuclease RelE of RelBE toxin-antitoxin system